MIVVMKPGTAASEIERVSQELRRWNITPEKIAGKPRISHKLCDQAKPGTAWSAKQALRDRIR